MLVRSGVYRHYKGPTYLVLGVAHDANAEDLMVDDPGGSLFSRTMPFGKRDVVVYVGLERAGIPGTPMAVRTVNDFNEVICVNDVCDAYGKHSGIYHAGTIQFACETCEQPMVPRFVRVTGQDNED